MRTLEEAVAWVVERSPDAPHAPLCLIVHVYGVEYSRARELYAAEQRRRAASVYARHIEDLRATDPRLADHLARRGVKLRNLPDSSPV